MRRREKEEAYAQAIVLEAQTHIEERSALLYLDKCDFSEAPCLQKSGDSVDVLCGIRSEDCCIPCFSHTLMGSFSLFLNQLSVRQNVKLKHNQVCFCILLLCVL